MANLLWSRNHDHHCHKLLKLLLLLLLLIFLNRAKSPSETQISRRTLWATSPEKYISYEVLRRDSVPCNRPGIPYYSCREGGAKANPYTRGCSMITGCRGGNP
ncbi:hypothetical protein IEQ34_004570 [Dendrobium chrysotoxum]|uniref:Rapid ALkalinization Factor n=1 Tax=Dendrobium chrysotoxum TaxID=161865 RepID=A0AAV7HGA2_DENCH|nr:hypothetical protein IEQ34_004570 [Dendrobium chrysotoxum]